MASIIKADIWQSSTGLTKQTVIKTYHFESPASTVNDTASFVPTPFSITVTPTSSTSRFALWYSNWANVSTNVTHGCATFYRNNINLGNAYGFANFYTSSGGYTEFFLAMNYVDSPGTANQINYTVYIRDEGSGTFTNGSGVRKGSFIIQEIAG